MKNKRFLLLACFLIALFCGLCYLNWRAFYTINHGQGLFTVVWAILLCLAETFTFFIFTSFSLAIIRKDDDQDKSDKHYKDTDYNVYCPNVDIFITTINESFDIISSTVLGCLNIDYPKKRIFILDDGRRADVRQLAQKLGCNYITRYTNEGFKAGNVNNGLKHSSGELILILDCDHVPVSTFLKEVVHNFMDEKVAMVQTPQHFFNPDAFQKNLKMHKSISNEQDLFYRVLEPGLANYESAMCGGTNFIIRRQYVTEAGGFPEDSVTEDSYLGLILESMGYKIVYYNKPLAAGRAPATFKEYLSQRVRWAKGNIQIFLNLKNMKYFFKLTLAQKFFYFVGILYFFYPFPRLVFLLSPVIFLLFDIVPVLVTVYQVVVFQASYFLMKIIFSMLASKKYRHALITDVYESATTLFLIFNLLKMLLIPGRLKRQKYVVTNKEDHEDEKTIYWRYLLPVSLLTFVLILASVQGVYDLMFANPTNPGSIWVNLFWNTYNLGVLIYAIRVIIEKPEYRKYIRLPIKISGFMKTRSNKSIPVDVMNISKGGILIKTDTNIDEIKSEFSSKCTLLLNNDSVFEVKILRINKEKNDTNFIQAEFLTDYYIEHGEFSKIPLADKLIRIMYDNSNDWDIKTG